MVHICPAIKGEDILSWISIKYNILKVILTINMGKTNHAVTGCASRDYVKDLIFRCYMMIFSVCLSPIPYQLPILISYVQRVMFKI